MSRAVVPKSLHFSEFHRISLVEGFLVYLSLILSNFLYIVIALQSLVLKLRYPQMWMRVQDKVTTNAIFALIFSSRDGSR